MNESHHKSGRPTSFAPISYQEKKFTMSGKKFTMSGKKIRTGKHADVCMRTEIDFLVCALVLFFFILKGINESCGVWMSYGTREWVLTHVKVSCQSNESRHMCMMGCRACVIRGLSSSCEVPICNTLQHTTTHFTLQRNSAQCNPLQHAATRCYTVATHCNALQRIATHCHCGNG